MTLTCPGPHRDDRERLIVGTLRICTACFDRLATEIAGLPALYEACGDALVASGVAEGEKVTHRRDPGLVLSLPAMVARDHIRAELVAWTRIVHDERGLSGWPADNVAAMAAWLGRQVDWLARQDYAEEVARSIHETTGEARRAAYPTKVRRITVGACPQPECGGTLVAWLRTEDDLLPSEIRCDAEPGEDDEPHVWPAHEWMTLGRWIVARVEAVANLRAHLGRR